MKRLLLLAFTVFCVWGMVNAEDISGPLSGTMDPGVYNVVGNIFVPQNDSLILEPGTTFIFMGDINFTIYGYIYFVGTEEDSIILKKAPGYEAWNGLNCNPSTIAGSRLEYCVIDGSDMQGFETFGCDFELRHCTIKNSSTQIC